MRIKNQLIKVTFPSSNTVVEIKCMRRDIEKIFDKRSALAIKTKLKSIGEGWKGVTVSGDVDGLFLEIKVL